MLSTTSSGQLPFLGLLFCFFIRIRVVNIFDIFNGGFSTSVEIAKRNEMHKFAVIPQRWVVERSFFMRSAGMRQMLASKSNSAHSASINSDFLTIKMTSRCNASFEGRAMSDV